MKLLNLVFNRIGNSISVMLDYPDHNIQLVDQVEFCTQKQCVVIDKITAGENILIVEMIIKSNNTKKVKIHFDKDGVEITGIGRLYPVDDGYTKSIDPDTLFKISMDRDLSQFIKNEKLFIHQEGFFKSLSVLLEMEVFKY